MKTRDSFRPSGFALPTVLIAGLVAMMVLMAALTASSSTRTALDQQYYQQLARSAAESGVARAQDCLQDNGYISRWAGRTLTPGTSCTGYPDSTAEDFIMQSGNIETTYQVASLSASLDVKYLDVTGIVRLKRLATGSIWKTYEFKQRARISSEIGFGHIAFGYRYSGSSSTHNGAFFGSLARDGTVMSLGINTVGQLGHGNTSMTTIPKKYDLPEDARVKRLYASFLSTGSAMYAQTHDAEIYASGLNDEGQLGLGHTNSPITVPQKIDIGTNRVSYVDNTSQATFIVTQNGNLLASGSCQDGLLGSGATCPNRTTMTRVNLPSIISAGRATEKFAADRRTAYVITSNGFVYGWGENNFGQLADGTTTNRSNPVRIGATIFTNTETTRAIDISFDGNVVYILRDDGQLYAAGLNSDYQMGFAGLESYSSLQRIDTHIAAHCGGQINKVVTDHSHAAVMTNTGEVCTFGYNVNGELGHGVTSPRATVKKVSGLPTGVRAVDIWVNSVKTGAYGRANNTFIVGNNGRVYGTGSNYYGQLGNNSTTNRSSFVQMQVFNATEPAARVQSGYGTTVIYTKSGRIYTVGNNENGQLGDGTTTNRRIPFAARYTNIGPPVFF